MIRNFNGQQFQLTTEKVLIHIDSNTGFIADFHLGKSTHFRKAGIAIPSNIISSELSRLEEIIKTYQLKSVIFLGDLFHSDLNAEWDLFLQFLESHNTLEFTLIMGNHDILPENSYVKPNLSVVNEPFRWNSFILSHHPVEKQILTHSPNAFNLAGHIHPGMKVTGKARTSIKMACYLERENQLILPAFGKFTGLSNENIKYVKSAYLVGSESIFQIP